MSYPFQIKLDNAYSAIGHSLMAPGQVEFAQDLCYHDDAKS
ncbi:MAG: hypothetical protein ACE5HI_04330 [bacterium]